MKNLMTIFTLSGLSAREWLRLKFFHIVVFFGLLFVGFSHLLSSLTFSVQERLLYDFGLGSLELALVMIASLIGSHTIHREIDRKTMFILLARPIWRSQIVLGAVGAIFILCLLFTVGFILSLMLTAGGTVPVEGVLLSAFATLQKAVLIASVAIAFGLLVRPLLALVASILYWILCYSIIDIQFFVEKMKSAELSALVDTAKNFLPQFYTYNWKSYYYTQNIPIANEVMWVTLHNLAWTCVWLLIASLVFRRKEIA